MSTSEREDLQTEVWKPRQLTGGLAQEMSWLGCARTFGCFSISSHFPQMLCCKFNSRRAMGLDFHGHQTVGRFYFLFFIFLALYFPFFHPSTCNQWSTVHFPFLLRSIRDPGNWPYLKEKKHINVQHSLKAVFPPKPQTTLGRKLAAPFYGLI